MKEAWKRIDRYRLYEFSSRGRVRNVKTGRCLKPWLHKDTKYPSIKVWPEGKTVVLHQLICEAFHGPRPDGFEVAHGNGDRGDCRSSNLRWDTRSNNSKDSIRHGTHVTQRGVDCHMTKLTERQVRWAFKSVLSHRRIGSMLGVTHAAIGALKRGKSWAHLRK